MLVRSLAALFSHRDSQDVADKVAKRAQRGYNSESRGLARVVSHQPPTARNDIARDCTGRQRVGEKRFRLYW